MEHTLNLLKSDEDLQTQLQEKESHVQSLEEEKASWLSHGVQAEFEKKEEVW